MNLITAISFRATRVALFVALASSVVAASALAGPIVSESFDYTGGGASVDGQGGGVGWQAGSNWNEGTGDGLTGAATVETGSLFLSSGYATSGNRLRLSATASTDASATKYLTATRKVGTDVGSVGGDLWLSFLYKRADNTFNGWDLVNGVSDGIQSELRNNAPNGIHMRARAKRQNLDGIQNRYKSHGDGEELTAPGINGGDTFLFVVRYQNLGETTDGPTTGVNRPGQMWVLDGAGYDTVAASAGTLYSEAHTVALAINGDNTDDRMLSGDTYGFWHLYYARAAVLADPFVTEWDELRWGDSIDDILPGFTEAQIGGIPEPSTFLLGALAGLSLVGLRRRSK